MEMVRALFFDAYGTLFDVNSVTGACSEQFGEAGRAITALWRSKQLEYTWLRSLMGRYEDFEKVTEQALAAACRKTGVEPGKEKVAALMKTYDYLAPFPEVKAVLEALNYLPLGILSNGTPRMLAAAVESSGLAGIFRHVVSVHERRTFKPAPEVYELACRASGLAAGEIGFVSSNYFDVAGAVSFGFRTVWVNRRSEKPDELGVAPAYELADLAGLSSLFG